MKKLHLLLLSGLLFIAAGCSEDSSDLKPNVAKSEYPDSNNPFRVRISDALQEAERVRNDLFAEGTRSMTEVKSIQAVTARATRSGGVDTMYYIVNYANNSGFSVLSADKRIPVIQAISDEGSLSLSDTSYNKGLALFFRQLDERYYGGIIEDPITPPSNPVDTTIHDFLHPDRQTFKMDPIVHTKVREWDQYEPFNYYCPPVYQYSSEPKCLVGCMALSLGQILSVFEYPKKIDEYSYDWATIKSVHSYPTFRLLAQLGSKDYLKLAYGYISYYPYGTAGKRDSLPPALEKLGYLAEEKKGFPISWAKNKLKSGQPLLIYSFDSSNLNMGHAWVIDAVYQYLSHDVYDDGGTKEEYVELYHCVWGYGKRGDGYYAVSSDYVGATDSQRPEEGESGSMSTRFWIDYTYSGFTHK